MCCLDLEADSTDARSGPALFLLEEDTRFTPSLNSLAKVLHTLACRNSAGK